MRRAIVALSVVCALLVGAVVVEGVALVTDRAAIHVLNTQPPQQGPKGDPGPSGPAGPPGPVGPAGVAGQDASIGFGEYATVSGTQAMCNDLLRTIGDLEGDLRRLVGEGYFNFYGSSACADVR